ncbi:MAG: glycoside hydrolase family 5 protein [Treponema sp.]|nr:glycoside hydrolase family 5 protein [Treponema sp.]
MKRFDGFMHGVNLGGWYSQCNHTEERYDTFITEDDFKTIKSWGLDHIRLPVDYNLVETDDGTPKNKGFERIEKAALWCKNNNLNMILDLHKTAGFSFDAGKANNVFFDNEELQKRFYLLWERFAARFANIFEGSNCEICFELLNEVTDQSYSKSWNAITKKCIERIRKFAPDTKILVGSYWNNSLASVKDLDEPYDENIVYNFHCYEPLVFTHQGAPWVGPKMNVDFRFPLKSTFADYIKITAEKVGQIGTAFNAFDKNATVDKKYFETIFAEAVKIAEERNVLLYCGEYGVIDQTNPADILEWYRLICSVFNDNGIGRAAWSFKQMNFGLSDPWADGIRAELVKLL